MLCQPKPSLITVAFCEGDGEGWYECFANRSPLAKCGRTTRGQPRPQKKLKSAHLLRGLLKETIMLNKSLKVKLRRPRHGGRGFHFFYLDFLFLNYKSMHSPT